MCINAYLLLWIWTCELSQKEDCRAPPSWGKVRVLHITKNRLAPSSGRPTIWMSCFMPQVWFLFKTTLDVSETTWEVNGCNSGKLKELPWVLRVLTRSLCCYVARLYPPKSLCHGYLLQECTSRGSSVRISHRMINTLRHVWSDLEEGKSEEIWFSHFNESMSSFKWVWI